MATGQITDDEIRDLADKLHALSQQLSPQQRKFLDTLLQRASSEEAPGFRQRHPDDTADYYGVLVQYRAAAATPYTMDTLQNL